MKFCRRSKPRVTPQNPAAENRPTPGRPPRPREGWTGSIPHFFLVVGHNAIGQGTYNYKGVSEYKFYLENFKYTIDYINRVCPEIPLHLVTRPYGVSYNKQCKAVAKAIKEITDGKLSFGCNGHFNSARGAKGSEALVVSGTPDNFDDIFGEVFTDLLEEVGISQRHKYNGPDKDGIKYVNDGHNGAGMLNVMAGVNCASVILEPCFDYEYAESKLIFDNLGRIKNYFELIGETIVVSYFKRGIIALDQIDDSDLVEWMEEKNYIPS